MIPEEKVCTKCGEKKSLDEFRKVNRVKYGYGSICKKCTNKQREIRHKNKIIFQDETVVKKCKTCEENKFLNEFSIAKGRKFDRNSECKKCAKRLNPLHKKSAQKARNGLWDSYIVLRLSKRYKIPKNIIRTEFKEHIKPYREYLKLKREGKNVEYLFEAINEVIILPSKHKTCANCHKEKPIEEFNLSQKGKLGRRSHCIECQKELASEYRIKNREKIYAQQKESRVKHADRIKERRDKVIQEASDAYIAAILNMSVQEARQIPNAIENRRKLILLNRDIRNPQNLKNHGTREKSLSSNRH